MAWGLMGPVRTGLVAMVGAGGGFSSTFSWQTPGASASVSGGLLASLSTFGALPPICLLCCCSEKKRCVDWRTSALCFALKNRKQQLKTLQHHQSLSITLSLNSFTNHQSAFPTLVWPKPKVPHWSFNGRISSCHWKHSMWLKKLIWKEQDHLPQLFQSLTSYNKIIKWELLLVCILSGTNLIDIKFYLGSLLANLKHIRNT